MSDDTVRVLLVEDDEDDFVLVRDLLNEITIRRHELHWVKDYPSALDAMTCGEYDVCLLDYRLGDHDGLELMDEAVTRRCTAPIIFLTGLGDYQLDLKAMRAGAAEYLVKNEISVPLLERSIRYAVERRSTQEALRKSEEKYRELVEKASSIIMRLDMKGRITFLNEFGEAFFGITQEEVVGHHLIGSIMSPPDSSELDVVAQFRDLVQHPELQRGFETETIRRDGARVWIVWTARAISTQEGAPSGILCVGTDVTDRKLAEERLRLDEARFEALYELSHMAEAPTPDIGTFALEAAVRLTRSQIGLLGFLNESESMLIETLWSKSVKKDCESTQEYPHLVLENSGIWAEAIRKRRVVTVNNYETPRWEPLGHPFDHPPLHRLLAVPVFQEERIVALALVGNKDQDYDASDERHVTLLMDNMWKLVRSRRDRDALRRSEQQLRENNAMLQKVFDGISDALIMVDSELSIMMLNKAARQYYGIDPSEDVLGKTCYEVLRKQDKPCGECGYFLSVPNVSSVTFDRMGLMDADRLEQVVVYSVYGEDGTKDSSIVRVSDVTERKSIERQLLQNEKLAALGLLVSGITHEINNPNTFISFNLPILREYLEALMPVFDEYAERHPDLRLFYMPYPRFRADLFKLLGNMEHGTNRIAGIVSSLKTFMRKRESSELQRTDILKLLEQTVTLCQPEITKTVKAFHVHIQEDLPKIKTDPEAIEQIVLNLLINAAHASDKTDSEVTLRAFRGVHDGKHLIIEVQDNGMGMEEGVKKRIFDPFFTTKGPNVGTGLGLYICYNLVQNLGGRIEVDSAPGEGSTFRVILRDQDSTVVEQTT